MKNVMALLSTVEIKVIAVEKKPKLLSLNSSFFMIIRLRMWQ